MVSFDESVSSIASSAIVMSLGIVFGQSLALVTEALITRSLDPTTYGRVALAYTVMLTIGNVLLLGMHQGLPRLVSATESDESRKSLIQSAFVISLVVGCAGVMLTVLSTRVVATGSNQLELLTYVVFLSPFLVLFPFSRLSVSVLRSLERTLPAVLSRMVVSRGVGLGIWGFLFYLGYRTEAAIVYWLAVPALVTGAAGYFIRQNFPLWDLIVRRLDGDAVREVISFSWPLASSVVMFMLLSRLDILMIAYFLPPTEVGYYRAVQPLRQVAIFVLASFGFLFLPIATKYYEDGTMDSLERLFKSITKWAVVLTVPLILGLSIYSEAVVLFMFGEPYQPAAVPLSILVAGNFIRSVSGLDGELAKAINRPKIELYSAAVGVASNFILNIVLIRPYGIAGAAVATVLGYAIYNAIEIYAIYVRVGFTPFSRNMLKPTAVTIVFAGAYVSLTAISHDIVFAAGSTVLFGVVALLSLPLTGSIDETDEMLLSTLERRTGHEFSYLRRIFGIE